MVNINRNLETVVKSNKKKRQPERKYKAKNIEKGSLPLFNIKAKAKAKIKACDYRIKDHSELLSAFAQVISDWWKSFVCTTFIVFIYKNLKSFKHNSSCKQWFSFFYLKIFERISWYFIGMVKNS